MVDLIGKPGCLCELDSLINGPSSISFSSPLRFPRHKPAEPTIDFRSLAKRYFSGCMSTELVFDSSSAGDIHVSYSMFDTLNLIWWYYCYHVSWSKCLLLHCLKFKSTCPFYLYISILMNGIISMLTLCIQLVKPPN